MASRHSTGNAKNSAPKPSPNFKYNSNATSKTLHWDELEEWQKGNEYIRHGYRRLPQRNSCTPVNIHTHMWGSVLFLYFLATFYSTYVEFQVNTTWKDVAVMAIFLASGALCLAASAFYHTSGCHSKEVASRCHAYDYSGIVILIVGSFYPAIYYGFFCDSHIQNLYLTTMSLAGLGAAYIVLNPEYAKPTHRGARTTVFIGLGLCAIVPMTQLFLTHGFQTLISEMGINWILISGALYIGGALLYANRIPERLAPGRFDFLFSSHQIFHIFVVLAALAITRAC